MEINASRVNFALMPEEDILKTSHGEVSVKDNLKVSIQKETNKTYLEFDPKGMFSEEIFGVSSETLTGQGSFKYNSNSSRRKNFGHISLAIPYINPIMMTNQDNKIAAVTGCLHASRLVDIIRYKAFMVKVLNNTPGHIAIDKMAKNKIKGSSVKELKFLPSSTKSSRMYSFYSVSREFFSKKDINSTGFDTINNFRDIAEVTIGAYAVISLLQELDLDKEIIVTDRLITDMSHAKKPNPKAQKIALLKYKILMSMKKNGLKYSDFTTLVLRVPPAADRDAKLVQDISGKVSVQIADVVKNYYHPLIEKNNLMKKRHFPLLSSTKELYAESSREWSRDLPLNDPLFISYGHQIQTAIESLIIDGLGKSIAKKFGIAREEVLSKRSNYTGRGVITPDPDLLLDEIGLPLNLVYDIVYEPFKAWLAKKGELSALKLIENQRQGYKYFWDPIDTPIDLAGDTNVNALATNIDLDNKIKSNQLLREYLSTIRTLAIRFPSLHQFNKLGFRIKLVHDSTIHLHPLVCAPYNADFDGDQMSIYVQFLESTVREIDERLTPSRKLLGASGSPLIAPSQDAVLGSYYMTLKEEEKPDVKEFDSYYEMRRAYEMGEVGLHEVVEVRYPRYDKSIFQNEYMKHRAKISSKQDHFIPTDDLRRGQQLIDSVPVIPEDIDFGETKFVKSTVGRFLFNEVIPQDLGYVNRVESPYELEIDTMIEDAGNKGIIAKQIKDIIQKITFTKSHEEIIYILDKIKELGYGFATKSGMSITMQDLVPHKDKSKILAKAYKEVEKIENSGGTSEDKIAVWKKASAELTKVTMESLPADNSVKMMSISGSRGNQTQVSQLLCMRSLMADAKGNIIDTPITSSFQDGLTQPELFIGSYATRKGMFDRSNRTKVTGYTNRVMTYGMEDEVIYHGDCGDTEGIPIKATEHKSLSASVIGKISLQDLVDDKGNVFCKAGHIISVLNKKKVDKFYGDKGIRVRSPITCKSKEGVCCKCYGYMYDKIRFSRIGDPVGIIAAQTLGEPGTQLTMRTFHTGGSAEGDITKGFDGIARLLTTADYKSTVEAYYEKAKLPNPDKEYTYEDEKDRVRREVLENLPKYIMDKNTVVSFASFGIIRDDLYEALVKDIAFKLDNSYASQGVALTSVHFELIARKMLSNFKVVESGDSIYMPGDVISWNELVNTNMKLILEKSDKPILVEPVFKSTKELGITSDHIMTALTFRDISLLASKAAIVQTEDTLTNPISGTVVANPMPNGKLAWKYKKLIDEDNDEIKSKDELYKEFGLDEIAWEEAEKPVETVKETTQMQEAIAEWTKAIEEESTTQEPIEEQQEEISEPNFEWQGRVEEETEEKPEELDEEEAEQGEQVEDKKEDTSIPSFGIDWDK